MDDTPVIDGRSRDEVLEELRTVASNYTDGWDPFSDDSGTTLLRIFSRFEMDVLRRLESVPGKHRLAFYDAFGFARRPPNPPRIPLTFTTIEELEENVVIPGGTQVVAETEDGSGVFEIPQDGGFEAVPATMDEAYGVDPTTDGIFDHGERWERGSEATLFTGVDIQDHVLYLGHEDLLTVDSGVTMTIRLRTTATVETLTERLAWEYHGTDEEGSIGWHTLPRKTTEPADLFSTSDADLEGLLEDAFELRFTLPGAIAPYAVDDVESRWIRARALDDDPAVFDIEIESISVNVQRGVDNGGLRPDNALSNDVPLSVEGDEDVFPFGRVPQPPATAYLASEEVFTKKGDTVSVRFEPPEGDGSPWGEPGSDDANSSGTPASRPTGGGVLDGSPEISWEYWNGTGWDRLKRLDDGTDVLTEPGTVTFVVPDDLDATTVSGHEGYWIRARLVSGNYGQPRYAISEDGSRGELVERPRPPRFGGISLGYDQRGKGFEQVLTYNNLAYRDVRRHDATGTVVPYLRLPDDRQTLYVGFSDRLREGPVHLYVPLSDGTYPRSFDPETRWEYCADPERDRWTTLEVHDRTDGLTKRGILGITFPEPTTAFELFGVEKHWIRARIAGDEFVPRSRGQLVNEPDRWIDGRLAEDRTMPQTSTSPPELSGLYPNTQWAYNVRTIDREVLGSSDGSHDQVFSCNQTPVTEIEVWVDELSVLSDSERRELIDMRPSDVERVPQRGNDPVEFWVRWTEVEDFLDSSTSSRHYTIDRTSGTITFGDGRRGAIPPAGDDNVRVAYKTGGQIEGTVDRGSVEELKTPITLVDSVTNVEPSDAGTDVETLDAVVSRAPNRIRNRGRAVTASDVEHVAMEDSRALGNVKCVPDRDDDGTPIPGRVTVLVVPEERRGRPTPSVGLKERVQDSIRDRAPATLVEAGGHEITVRGPDYAEISVETTIGAGDVESVSSFTDVVEAELETFLHPLSGGPTGDGWDFGESPRVDDVTAFLETIDGVDTVTDVAVTIATKGEAITIGPTDVEPSLEWDELVCSGSHRATIRTTGRK